VVIPTTFASVPEYKSTLRNAIIELLNGRLFELASSFQQVLRMIDTAGYVPMSVARAPGRGSGAGGSNVAAAMSDAPRCTHGATNLCSVKKDGPNKGRLFFACPQKQGSQCKFFQWADEYQRQRSRARGEEETARITERPPPSLHEQGDCALCRV
jgi:hypothetical protein